MADAEPYYCRGDHKEEKEDLTYAVRTALTEGVRTSSMRFEPTSVLAGAQPSVVEIWVTCSLGHDNVFYVERGK